MTETNPSVRTGFGPAGEGVLAHWARPWAELPHRLALFAGIWIVGALALSGAHVLWRPTAPPAPAPAIQRPISLPTISPPVKRAGLPVAAVGDSRISTASILGADVFDRSKKKIGTLADVSIDTTSGAAMAVVRVAGALDARAKRIAVPMRSLAFKSNGFKQWAVIDLGRKALTAYPSFVPN